MHVPHQAFNHLRSILAICIALAGLFVFLMWRDTRPRDYYPHVTARVTYVDKRYGDKPNRDFDKYRYMVLDKLPYPVEIYADKQAPNIDSLHVGDVVTLWYILFDDPSWPSGKGVNPRFIYKGSKPVFGNDGKFSVAMGEVVMFILFLTCWFSVVMYRKGKIKW